MKKLLILIFICSLHNVFSQNSNNDTKTETFKREKADNIQINPCDGCVFNETANSQKNSKSTDKVYNITTVDFKPDFYGGIKKLNKFVNYNILHPEEELNVKGDVFVTFIIEKDGTLSDIKVLRDIGYGTGAEVKRVLKKCPKWIPGTNNHKLVRVFYCLPITITINDQS